MGTIGVCLSLPTGKGNVRDSIELARNQSWQILLRVHGADNTDSQEAMTDQADPGHEIKPVPPKYVKVFSEFARPCGWWR